MSRSTSMRSIVVFTAFVVTSTVITILLFIARIELHKRVLATYEDTLSGFAPFVAESLMWQEGEWIFKPNSRFFPSAVSASFKKATPGKPQAGLWLSSEVNESMKPMLAEQSAVPFTAGSNLSALLLTRNNTVFWQSPSAVNSEFIKSKNNPSLVVAGSRWAQELVCGLDQDIMCAEQEFTAAPDQPATRLVLIWQNAGAKNYLKQLQRTVLVALVLLGAALIALQALALSWVLRPLKQVRTSVDRVIGGEQSRVEGTYPKELDGLVTSFNTLLAHEQNRQQRLRNSLERLAHVLRTPLAVLSSRKFQHADDRAAVTEQSERMMHIVESELRKLTLNEQTNGLLAEATPIQPIIERITNAYRFLPRADTKQVPLTFKLEFETPSAVFPGNQQDLQDLYGTLLENAIRFALTTVRFTLTQSSQPYAKVVLTLEDDGPGFSQKQLQQLASEEPVLCSSSNSFGLGLSIVRDIVNAHQGHMHVDQSSLGGARISIAL